MDILQISNTGTVPVHTLSTGNITIGSAGGSGNSGMYMTTGGWSSPNVYASNSMSTAVLNIMAEGNGDAMIKTKKHTINLDEMAEVIETVKERLLILSPAFEKHEQYPALKEAYEHYKLIEALCREEEIK
jgi:hypothetical protein